jgi:hypothetical protein
MGSFARRRAGRKTVQGVVLSRSRAIASAARGGCRSNHRLGIDSKITIQGPTSGNGITISGGDSQRLFYVASTGTLSLDDLTITGDSAGNRGGPNGGSSVTD